MSESNKEEKSRKLNKVSLIIMICILMIFCFGIGYAFKDRLSVNNFNSSSQKNSSKGASSTECAELDVVENLDVTDSQVSNLIATLSRANTYYCGVWDYYTAGKYTTSDISNDLAFAITMSNLYADGVKLDEGTEVSKEQFSKKLASIFGKDYEYEYVDRRGCPSYTYDSSKEAYIQGIAACGGTCGPTNMKRIVKAIKTDSTMEIYVRVLFIDDYTNAIKVNGQEFLKYYKDAAKSQELDLDRDYENFPYETDSNYNKGSLYKFTFNNEDGNYVFVSSELVE